jgi:fructose-specific component phosphotransferase system IIB-like protein
MHQAALAQNAIGPALAKAGLELSSRLDDADYVIIVTITPDLADAAKSHMVVSGVQENLRKPRNSSLADARAGIAELERWGQSRSAPVYGP